jgi:hypothetical protein
MARARLDRAKAFLEEGDRVCVGRCGGGRATFTLAGWDGYWMVGKGGGCDYAPSAIVSVNGERMTFLDPPWLNAAYDDRTGRRYGDHGTAQQALEWALHEGDRVLEVDDPIQFLLAWREGGAWRDWPEFYRWLDPLPRSSASEVRP